MRAIDAWINCNLVTLLVTCLSVMRCWAWHQEIRGALPRLTGRDAALGRLNLTVARWFIAVNAAVFLLGLYLVQVARDIDRTASAARPARVPEYVVQGTAAFTCIWIAVAVAVWQFSRAMDRIARMAPSPPIHTLRREDERLTGG